MQSIRELWDSLRAPQAPLASESNPFLLFIFAFAKMVLALVQVLIAVVVLALAGVALLLLLTIAALLGLTRALSKATNFVWERRKTTVTTNTTPDALGAGAARIGGVIVAAGVALALLLQTPLLPPEVRENSTFLLFVAQGLACIVGFLVLDFQAKQARRPVRIGTRVVSGGIMALLAVCFLLAVGGQDPSTRQLGQEFGVVVATVVLFQFAAGNADILARVQKWWHGALLVGWYGNIGAMIVVVLAWTHGHLTQPDAILTAAFLVTYAAMPTTKYISLILTSSHGNKVVQAGLGTFVVLPVLGGWVYLIALICPGLLPGWIGNAILFSTALAWGISYGMDTILRGREEVPLREFLLAIGLQGGLMLLVGAIGAFLPSSAPLVIALLCQETVSNLPGGGISFVTELFKKRPESATRWFRPTGVQLWCSAGFGGLLCALMVLCFASILVKQSTVLLIAGGITIGLLQAVPWFRVAQRACLEWAEKPARANAILVTALTTATVVIGGLAVWVALHGSYSEASLTAIWYTMARIPTAISLGAFGLLGVLLVGPRAPRGWRYLLAASTGAVFLGFAWFIPALLMGDSIVGPGTMTQIAGAVLVALVYTALNSGHFRTMAKEALAGKPETWGNSPIPHPTAKEGEAEELNG